MQVMGIVVTPSSRTTVCRLVSSSKLIRQLGHVSIELQVTIGCECEKRRLLGSQIFKFFIFSSSVSGALLVHGHEGLACECVCSRGNDGGDGLDGCDVRNGLDSGGACDGLSLKCRCDLNLDGINVHEETLRDRVGCATTQGLGSQICLFPL